MDLGIKQDFRGVSFGGILKEDENTDPNWPS